MMKFSRPSQLIPTKWGECLVFEGLRISVAAVVGMVADEMTREEILAWFPDLGVEDIREALRFAAETVRERELPLVMVP